MPDLASLAYLHCCDHLIQGLFPFLQLMLVNGNQLSPEPVYLFFHVRDLHLCRNL